MRAVVLVCGTAYCTIYTASLVKQLLMDGVPFIYIPYDPQTDKKDYWASLMKYMGPTDLKRTVHTFPTVMLLVKSPGLPLESVDWSMTHAQVLKTLNDAMIKNSAARLLTTNRFIKTIGAVEAYSSFSKDVGFAFGG